MAYQNFYATKLSAGISDSVTSFDVDTPPTATSGRLVLEPRNPATREIIQYTGVAGTTLTGVTRGEGGTTAVSHNASVLVEMNLTAEDIQDLYDAFDTFSGTADWRTVASAVSSVAYNGLHSYDMVLNAVDLTSSLSAGMRIRTTRTVAAPTQSTSLNGTNQYYVKTTPNKLSFTDDFAVGAWIKLSSYGTSSVIASRYNGTSGWRFTVTSSGAISLEGYNGGVGNVSYVESRQLIPLNKWVHVAAQLDMSAFTATTTTSYVMIDGVDVASVVTRSGTNPTALIQAGNLEIGANNSGVDLFPGKIAQVAIFNAKVTQATLRGYMSQALAGTETSLASAYSFNNAITDLNTTTPNDLTAQGAAVATNADSPFGGQASGSISSTLDYGVIMSVTLGGGNTTLVIQTPEGNTIPSTGGVSALSVSATKSPYGMPTGEDKHTITMLSNRAFSTSSPVAGTTYNPLGMFVIAPAGKFMFTHAGATYTARGAGTGDMKVSWGTAATTAALAETTVGHYFTHPGIGDFIVRNTSAPTLISNTSNTVYYLQLVTSTAGLTTISYRGDLGGLMTIKLKNAYI